MKNEKGFTLIELSISIVAFVLFAIIVANLNYAIFSNSIYAKQNAILTEKAVEILELVGTMEIESDFNEDGNLIDDSSIYTKLTSNDNYNTFEKTQNRIAFKENNFDYIIEFSDYASEEEHQGAEVNIVKIITVRVSQEISGKVEKVEIKRLLISK